jgi:hypothetical protein
MNKAWNKNDTVNYGTKYYEQGQLPFNSQKDANPKEVEEWLKNDYFMGMHFDPMQLFVVVPALIQITVLGMMAVAMWMNNVVFS